MTEGSLNKDVVEKQRVICPECGNAQDVAMNRRESVDFCTKCDFPLFWTPGVVVKGETDNSDALRRLPGQGGRATVASKPCPNCSEENPLEASFCWRCGSPMTLPEPAPEPEPVFQVVNLPPVPAPAAPPEPEFELAWWWWVIGGATVLAVILLIIVLVAL